MRRPSVSSERTNNATQKGARKEDYATLQEEIQDIGRAKAEEFVGNVLGDTSGMPASRVVGMGDRLGLFEDLKANGPATSAELVARTSINEQPGL